MEFFKTERVSPSTIRIMDVSGVAAFLVEGNERAALIDTCSGVGNLKAFVESLTEKPLTVILTHGHCDHAGGAAPFEEVYLSKEDEYLVSYHATMDMKIDFVRFSSPADVFAQIKEEDFVPERTAGYLPLVNGQIFDLGGITLEAVSVPGHTHGMTCVLNIEERSILFGDACNPSVFLWDEESYSVEAYRNSLLALKKMEDRYDTVYLSHGPAVISKEILDGVIEVCNEILAGTNDWQPFIFMGHDLRLAKQEENHVRKDGGLGNIVYNPNKVFESES